jgi:hypothetical protein
MLQLLLKLTSGSGNVIRLKNLLSFVLCAACLPALAHASKKNVLPDACGADDVEFNLTPASGLPASAPIPDGKARIVFIESYDKPGVLHGGGWGGGKNFTTRFGMDGAWVGAAGGNNYFVVDVAPGEHKLCASVKGKKEYIGMDSVTAEAGKTYYYDAKYSFESSAVNTYGGNNQMYSGRVVHYDAAYSVLKEDDGKFRVKSAEPVTSAPTK